MTRPKIGSLFSGVGGLDMAVSAFYDADVAWHVEFDEAPSKVLAAQYPGVPNHGDVTTTDWTAVEPIDILTGGFPCQDLSLAGRRAGMRPGTRSGLWADYLAAIAALTPKIVVIENVRGLLSGCAESAGDLEPCPGCVGDGEHRPPLRALGRVLGDLAGLGYDAKWCGVRASDAGAPHQRFRVFVVAHPVRSGSGGGRGAVASGRGEGARTDVAADGADTRSHRRFESANAAYPDDFGQERDRGAWAGRDGSSHDGRTAADICGATIREHPGRTPAEETGTSASDGLTSDGRVRPDPHRRKTTANAAGCGCDGRAHEPIRVEERRASASRSGGETWGEFWPAIDRWERSLGSDAPAPVRPDGRDGRNRLNPELTEWMMGWPAGWVTDPDIGLTRAQQLKACGNGVVPQQAHLALSLLTQHELEHA